LNLRAANTDGPCGILGGSFDPVHAAHLALARHAMESLALARILWIPGGTPPHREAPRADSAQRIAMLQLALAGETRYCIDLREIRKSSPGYTVETLASLREEYGHTLPLVLLIGADQFARLSTWHRWLRLFELAHVAVFTRPGWSTDDIADPAVREAFDLRRDDNKGSWAQHGAGAILPVEMPPMSVSSTQIRRSIAAGQQPLGLLPDAVLDYIGREGLYTKGN